MGGIFGLFLLLSLIALVAVESEDNRGDHQRSYYNWVKKSGEWQAIPVEIASNSPVLDEKNFYALQNSDKETKAIQKGVKGGKDKSLFPSQVGQDEFISSLFRQKLGGYYVDLASNHWKKLSNTFALEKVYRWDGLCIEPNRMYRKGILENRMCKLLINPVYSTSGKEVRFNTNGVFGGIVDKEMFNFKKEEKDEILETVTLVNALSYANAPQVIDYFSLDVEGGEDHVLKYFDFGMYTFLSMSIEHPSKFLHDHISSFGYWFLKQMRHQKYNFFGECIYIHESHPHFKALMDKHRTKTDPTVTWAPEGQEKYQHLPKWPPLVMVQAEAETEVEVETEGKSDTGNGNGNGDKAGAKVSREKNTKLRKVDR